MAKPLRVVDLFAGWGGFTLGAQQAGHRVVWAANHWAVAVQAHQAMHPEVEHVCQDLHQADWSLVPAYDLLVASPACQGHSTASQARRRKFHDAQRATAWVVIQAAEVTEPRAIIIENVPAFRRWGPKGKPGAMYKQWKRALEVLGYNITEHIVDATRHGVPQRRKRLFIVAMRKPGFTYKPMLPTDAPEPAFGPNIEWGRGVWRPIHAVKPGKQARILRGQERFGVRGRFIGQDVSLSTRAKAASGIPLTEAIRTITCQDQWWVSKGRGYSRPLTERETARAMGFPEWYTWPQTATREEIITGLGNAVCPPVARDIIAQVAEAMGAGARRPARAAKRLPSGDIDLLELARQARGENPITATKRRLMSY